MKKEDTKLTPQEERISENIAKGLVKRVDEIVAKRKEDGECGCKISKFSLAYNLFLVMCFIALIVIHSIKIALFI